MNEPKDCPMIFNRLVAITTCRKEGCAWWVPERQSATLEETAEQNLKTITIPGHCVALDWGKK